ncbi:MAG: hypothetical protein PHQ18_01975 [Patescibacteria group bacterium]|nr:hypothetical protein [Patescibacteria group bacterium]
MQEVFLKLIEQLNGAVFILLLLLILAFWLVVKITRVITIFDKFKEERKEMKDDIKNDRQEMKDDVKKINDNLSEIKATVKLLYEGGLQTLKSHSPVSLTSKGTEISNNLNLQKMVDDHWSTIRSKLESKNLSNPYDIQVTAMEIAHDCFEKIFTKEEQDRIKLHAYNIGINILEIIPIIGVLSRDKYLLEKGIKVDEIDKHAPIK